MGVEARGVRHHVDGHAAEGAVLHAGHRVPVGDHPPATEADEAGCQRSQPGAEPLDAGEALAELVGGDLVGPGGGAAHEVGHAEAVVGERMAGVPVDGRHAGGEHRRPEAVAGPLVAHARVGRGGAGVEAHDQQAHPGRHGVGKAALALDVDLHGVVARPGLAEDDEAGADDQVGRTIRPPPAADQRFEAQRGPGPDVEPCVQAGQEQWQVRIGAAGAESVVGKRHPARVGGSSTRVHAFGKPASRVEASKSSATPRKPR